MYSMALFSATERPSELTTFPFPLIACLLLNVNLSFFYSMAILPGLNRPLANNHI